MGRLYDEGVTELRRMARDVDEHGNPIQSPHQQWAVQELLRIQRRLIEVAPVAMRRMVEIACIDLATSDDPSTAEARYGAREWLVEGGLVSPPEFEALTEAQLLAIVNKRLDEGQA